MSAYTMEDLQARAAQARALLEQLILEALSKEPNGLYNSELARRLALESAYKGKQTNYLTYSLLGGLIADGRVVEERRDRRIYYHLAATQ